jgi:hypothetical protein
MKIPEGQRFFCGLGLAVQAFAPGGSGAEGNALLWLPAGQGADAPPSDPGRHAQVFRGPPSPKAHALAAVSLWTDQGGGPGGEPNARALPATRPTSTLTKTEWRAQLPFQTVSQFVVVQLAHVLSVAFVRAEE